MKMIWYVCLLVIYKVMQLAHNIQLRVVHCIM